MNCIELSDQMEEKVIKIMQQDHTNFQLPGDFTCTSSIDLQSFVPTNILTGIV